MVVLSGEKSSGQDRPSAIASYDNPRSNRAGLSTLLRLNFDQPVFSLDIFHGRLEPCFRPRLLSAVSKDSKKSGLIKNVAFAAHVDFLLFIGGIEDSAGYVVRYKFARRLELCVDKSIGENSLGTNLLSRRGFSLYQNGPRV